MNAIEADGALAAIGRLALALRQLEEELQRRSDVITKQNELLEAQQAQIEALTPAPIDGDAKPPLQLVADNSKDEKGK